MKKCPKCKKTYGYKGGWAGRYVFCPMCGGELVEVKRRSVYLSEEEWENSNRVEYAVPWNEDIKLKGLEDESF